MADHDELAAAVTVTCELTGTVLSAVALAAFVADLLPFGVPPVLAALHRCRQEVRGRLTVAEVLLRLEDGRPTADAAWAMMPGDEGATVVWTDEMAQAYGVAHGLRRAGDEIGARLAFGREYDGLVRAARAARQPVRWWPSLGHDPARRVDALREAVRLGRLPAASVVHLLPPPACADEGLTAES